MNDSQIKVDRIREDIMSLPPSRRGHLLQWLIEMDKREWDHELEEDFSDNGPGMPLLEQVKKDFRAGRCAQWK